MSKLAYTPTPHQIEDSKTLVDYERGLLWADPGTGKTFTTIMGIDLIGFDRVVIVCPKIAQSMWKEELQKHLGWDAFIFKSIRKGVGYFYNRALIVTYDLLARNEDVQRGFVRYAEGYDEYRSRKERNFKNTLLVLDEAHYIKSPTSKRAQFIAGKPAIPPFTTFVPGIHSKFADVWQLTGTPVTRHVDDLFTQLMIARPDLMRHYKVNNYNAFVDMFCTTQYKQYHPRAPKRKVVTGSKNLPKLEKLLEEAKVIRRKLADVVDELPPITYRTVGVTYKNVENVKIPTDPAALIRELNKPDSMMAKIRRQLGVAKVGDTVDYIKEVWAAPTLVGFWHKDVGNALFEALKDDYRVGYIDGSTGDREREEHIAAFNAGDLQLLFGQIKAMGVAANLQKAATHVIVAEEVMSPADLEQFVARVYRRGQTNHVQVDLIRSDHDLDAAMAELRLNKDAVIQQVI